MPARKKIKEVVAKKPQETKGTPETRFTYDRIKAREMLRYMDYVLLGNQQLQQRR